MKLARTKSDHSKDQKFIEAVRKYAHDERTNPRGDDDMCAYLVPETGERCLIGQVLHDVGERYERNWEGCNARRLLQELGYSYETAEMARRAQYESDHRVPWGEVVQWVWGEV